MSVEVRGMPILMIALLALAVFGGIGILLATAVVLENKSAEKHGDKVTHS
jgi:hypothetical protein